MRPQRSWDLYYESRAEMADEFREDQLQHETIHHSEAAANDQLADSSLDEAPLELTVTTTITPLTAMSTSSCQTVSTAFSSPTSSTTVAIVSSEDGSTLDLGAMVETHSTPSPTSETENMVDEFHDELLEYHQQPTQPMPAMIVEKMESPALPMPLKSDVEIKAGARFTSFTDFELTFEHWKATYFHPFRVASSETLRLPDGSTNMLFKYRYIVFHCAHYGVPRKRGNGKRPNQNYMPCGCRAMLRLNYSWSENALRVTTLNEEHTGHDATEEAYYKFAAKKHRHSSSSPTSSINGSVISSTTIRRVYASKRSRSGSPYSQASIKIPKNGQHTQTESPLNLSKNGSESGHLQAMLEIKRSTTSMEGPIPPISTTLPPASNAAPALSVLMFNHQQQQQRQQQHAYHELMRILSVNNGGTTTTTNGTMITGLNINGIQHCRVEPDRQRLIASIMQALSQHLALSRGFDLDQKLCDLKDVLKKWQLIPTAANTPIGTPTMAQPNFGPRSSSAAAAAAAMMVQAMSAGAGATTFAIPNGNSSFGSNGSPGMNGLISNGHYKH